MPDDAFRSEIMPRAKAQYAAANGPLIASAMLGYTNVCKNRCLYCGMRAGSQVPRYSIAADDIIATALMARDRGFRRIFLIAGENPNYPFEDVLRCVQTLHGAGMYVALALGELERGQYAELRKAGADEYVLKFEMGQREVFDRLNPSTDFDRRMAGIESVKASGMLLASGNIVDYPGQTLDMLAEDILLMQKLQIHWAPIIPYMPAKGTPLAAEGGRGDRVKCLKETAILRLLMPDVNITAQQPGDDLSKGLADDTGNLDALNAGANMLFCDLLPDAQAQAFRVVDDRQLTNAAHIEKMAQMAGMIVECGF